MWVSENGGEAVYEPAQTGGATSSTNSRVDQTVRTLR